MACDFLLLLVCTWQETQKRGSSPEFNLMFCFHPYFIRLDVKEALIRAMSVPCSPSALPEAANKTAGAPREARLAMPLSSTAKAVLAQPYPHTADPFFHHLSGRSTWDLPEVFLSLSGGVIHRITDLIPEWNMVQSDWQKSSTDCLGNSLFF